MGLDKKQYPLRSLLAEKPNKALGKLHRKLDKDDLALLSKIDVRVLSYTIDLQCYLFLGEQTRMVHRSNYFFRVKRPYLIDIKLALAPDFSEELRSHTDRVQ